ncbi:Predicted O-methyltransferase YrrM [Paenibacillus catalpae]|uniref:Predicted O-methyltransferase YrrM n=1 Tax=Paenibacillus catalpae TaxID=1045775 RepID=A0A1I1XHR1_9BACL|nr:O-methyltransferase [Paenibacillus catalpae]SFE05283.1 Predicted O-methyltransferase YrrM [Paenibacillus catalpae]
MNSLHTWEKVDAYITKRLIQQDSTLEQVLLNNEQADLPAIDVAPNQGKLLNLYAQMIGATRILEIGTLGGYSTIWMARALPEHGRLITLELDPHHAAIAGQNIALAGLSQRVDIRVGEALEQLAKLEEEGTAPFDLIFIDADKPNNPHYLQWALRFSRPGTVIIGDNVVRDGEVTNKHSTDPRVQGVRKFMDLLADDPRITATAIQTVGAKGYDGFVMGIVQG